MLLIWLACGFKHKTKKKRSQYIHNTAPGGTYFYFFICYVYESTFETHTTRREQQHAHAYNSSRPLREHNIEKRAQQLNTPTALLKKQKKHHRPPSFSAACCSCWNNRCSQRATPSRALHLKLPHNKALPVWAHIK